MMNVDIDVSMLRCTINLATFNHGRHMSLLQKNLQKQPRPFQASKKMLKGSIKGNCFLEDAKSCS
jgi:hypothetical protein